MVTGWSFLVGSSAFVQSYISCTSAFPREVVRIWTFTIVPSGIPESFGAATVPCQGPARAFSLSKDFWASDGVEVASAAKAVAAIRRNTTEAAMRDFMFNLSFSVSVSSALTRFALLITVIVNYNTRSSVKDFFGPVFHRPKSHAYLS